MMEEVTKFMITEEQQLAELNSRVTPILNVNVVVFKRSDTQNKMASPQFLLGHRNPQRYKDIVRNHWLFPGGRMKYDETPQEGAQRILKKELPGVSAHLKKIITAQSDMGHDHRAYGVTLYYLFEYIDGNPSPNDDLDDFVRVTEEEMRLKKNCNPIDVQILPEIQIAIRTMNSSQDEILVEVDRENREIGLIEKRVAHNTTQRFHRAAHIMLFNTHGQVVLQLRSQYKSTHPGRWDMPGGHNTAGHTIAQTAQLELMEEIGVAPPLTLQRIGLYQTKTQSEFFYLYHGVSDGPYGYDKTEVAAIQPFDCQKLLDGGYDAEYKILDHVKTYTEELRFVREPLLTGDKHASFDTI